MFGHTIEERENLPLRRLLLNEIVTRDLFLEEQAAITPRFQFESCLYDPLSITSLYGSEAMLREMLENSDFEGEFFLREPAMKAAGQILDWREISRIKILFSDDRIGPQLQSLDCFQLLLKKMA